MIKIVYIWYSNHITALVHRRIRPWIIFSVFLSHAKLVHVHVLSLSSANFLLVTCSTIRARPDGLLFSSLVVVSSIFYPLQGWSGCCNVFYSEDYLYIVCFKHCTPKDDVWVGNFYPWLYIFQIRLTLYLETYKKHFSYHILLFQVLPSVLFSYW